MKAHKKIIICTFILSIIFTIETLLLYLFEPNNPQGYYIWFENISIGILTGVIVSFIIEIGNYASLKNKLYEKLMSECIKFNDFLSRHIRALEQCLLTMDNYPNDTESVKIQLSNILTRLTRLTESLNKEYTKIGDLTFILSSNNPNKGKVNKSVTNTINSFFNIIALSTDVINSNNAITKGNITSCYNILLNGYKNSLTARQQLDFCVREMEHYHKFSKSWDATLNITNNMYERNITQNNLAIFECNSNRRNAIMQTYNAMDILSNIQNSKHSGVDKNINNTINSKTTKKKTQSK